MTKTKFYAAPLEGVTTYLWRRVHADIFGGADKYFTPFVSPNANCNFQTKELDELTHNEGLPVIPQILTNSAEHFLWAAREMADMGYSEINFNLGCPSGTVAAKRKGSGALADPVALDAMLEEIFAGLPRGMALSIKTRIGKKSPEEWPCLLAIYRKYPLSELIVHPRIQTEFYKGHAHREILPGTLVGKTCPLCYNGDVFTPAEATRVLMDYPGIDTVMVGRGLITDPALLRRLHGGAPASREELRTFHDVLYEAYCRRLSGDLNAIYRMRELWNYLSGSFCQTDQFLKKIRRAKTRADYLGAVDRLFQEAEMAPEPLPPMVG